MCGVGGWGDECGGGSRDGGGGGVKVAYSPGLRC